MASFCFFCPLQILLLVALTTSKDDGIWHVESRQLPQPSAAAQMAYNNLTSTLYLFGGYTSNGSDVVNSNNKIYKRNISNPANPWTTLSIQTPTIGFFSQIKNTVTIDNIVYFIGINNNSYICDQIYLFNLTAEKFVSHSIQSHKYAACSGCLVTNNTHIFMIGGIISPLTINYIQILDIKRNTWTYETVNLTFMEPGWAHQICNIADNKIYIFGGIIRYIPGKATNVMYRYDILSTRWHFLGYLSHWTSQGWMVFSNKYNKMYAVTLQDDFGDVALSVFDTNKEQIIFKSKLILPLFQTPILLNDDTITIYGGWPYSWHGNATYETTLSIFIQSVKVPLTIHKESSSVDIDTGLFVGIIVINTIISILIGCVVGVAWYRHRINTDEPLLNTPRHIM